MGDAEQDAVAIERHVAHLCQQVARAFHVVNFQQQGFVFLPTRDFQRRTGVREHIDLDRKVLEQTAERGDNAGVAGEEEGT